MIGNKARGGRALRIAMGIAALVVLLAGGAGAATPISSCTTISSPGSYVLTQDIINSSASTCIRITSNNVVFDGNGYTIDDADALTYDTTGVYVYNSFLTAITNVTVKNLKVTDWWHGIYYQNAHEGSIINNNASRNIEGIHLRGSSNNTITNNKANSSSQGIYLDSSDSNIITNNIASSSYIGIYIGYSSNNTLTNNKMTSNTYNLYLYGNADAYYNNSIDTSNKVDDNPIFYIRNGANAIYDSSTNAGTFYCIFCDNVTIKNLTLTKNGYGVYFWKTNNSKIENIKASSNMYGILLGFSSNNTLTNNNASSNSNGIFLWNSSNSALTNNNASSNSLGIYIYSSSGNTVYNNLFNNTNNFYFDGSIDANLWNTTKRTGNNIIGGPYLGGNFWANPSGTGFSETCSDGNGDGICDSSYSLASGNIDYLPLAKPHLIPITGSVHNINKGTNYTTIQAAINDASPGDEIQVDSGTYFENVDVNKRLILRGIDTGSGMPVVNANGSGSAITLNAEECVLEGFATTGASNPNYGPMFGIKVVSGNNVIKNNTASNSQYGIGLWGSSNNMLINNSASNNHIGIEISSSNNNTLIGNNASSNNYEGIDISSSNNNILIGNKASNNYQYGVLLYFSSNNTLRGNSANSNSRAGIYVIATNKNYFNNTIDVTNKVNSKPVYYFFNMQNVSLNGIDAGHLTLAYSSGFVLKNSNISNGDGINLYSSNNNTFFSNTVSHNYYGINMQSSNNNNFLNNTVFHNLNNGIDNSNNNVFIHNTILNNSKGTYLYRSSNNTISNNTFINAGLSVRYSYQNTVENNTVNGKPLVYLENVSDYTIIDAGQVILLNSNNITVKNLNLSDAVVGAELWRTNNSKITHNNVSNSLIGIYLYKSNDNVIANNTHLKSNHVITGGETASILLYDSNNNIIIENILNNNLGGIGLDGGNNNSLINNTAEGNDWFGIALNAADNNTLDGNILLNNEIGIGLDAEPSYNIIKRNLVSNNSYGILTFDTSGNIYNTITQNTFSNNKLWGILLGGASNIIYHNNFINNSNQSEDWEPNFWDSGYPSGGNYWSDYTGVDLKSGLSQNITGSDGIGDTPYNISGGARAQDRYPFMRMNGWLLPADTTPPASITNLRNISFVPNYINWTWTDPADADFSHIIVYIDEVFRTNVSKGIQFYNATGFSPNTTHTISTRTVDITGNANQTWLNHTARTSPAAPLDILSYYRSLGSNPNAVETTDLLRAADDWSRDTAPPGFTNPITTIQLLALADEWSRS